MEFHLTLLEALKLLNRAEGESDRPDEGLEPSELLFLLRKGPTPGLTEPGLIQALETLQANRMIEFHEAGEYAWDRGRVLGRRVTINAAGKSYLLEQLQKTGRIG